MRIPASFPTSDLGFQTSDPLKYSFSSLTTSTPLTTILSSPDTVSSPKQRWYQDKAVNEI